MSVPFADKDTVTILFFSDVHESLSIDTVKLTIAKIIKDSPIDYIFVGGDIQSTKHKLDYEEEMKASFLEEDSNYGELFLNELNDLDIPVLWIPGNHDSTKSYRENAPNSIHNKCVEIAPKLTVVGIGGSCPAYNSENQVVWLGYPHINGDVDITRIQTEIESVPESNSVFSFSDLNELLLFTHCPPSFSPSSHVTKNGEHITAGSESLSELYALVQSRYHVPLYLHGHCHQNLMFFIEKRDESKTCVISGGSVQYGYYSLISLKQEDAKWRVIKQSNLLL